MQLLANFIPFTIYHTYKGYFLRIVVEVVDAGIRFAATYPPPIIITFYISCKQKDVTKMGAYFSGAARPSMRTAGNIECPMVRQH